MNQMVVCERLREERSRLNLSQTALGEAGGVTKKTQMLYESGERKPDTDYLAAIASVGADIQYILIGVRSSVALTPDEQLFIQAYRALDAQGKLGAIGAVTGLQKAQEEVSSKKMVIKGKNQRVAGRDFNIFKLGKGGNDEGDEHQ